jgi:predicted esterase
VNTPRFDDFMDLYGHVHRLYTQGDPAQAFEIATREKDRFPKYAALLYHFRAGTIACAGDSAQALAILDEALAAGFWHPDRWWTWDDFKAMQDLPEFRQLWTRSKVRQAEAEANAGPEMLVFPPENRSSPWPLLLALHGNNYNANQTVDHWHTATGAGWLLGVPQSSHITGPGMYHWQDYAQDKDELQAHFAALCAQHPVDRSRVVLGGISQGAETALRLALKGEISARGVILACPGGPLIDSDDGLAPLIEASTGRDLRFAVIIGGQDEHHAPGGRQLVEQLRAGGFAVTAQEVAGIGHRYPADFDARLPGLLAGF